MYLLLPWTSLVWSGKRCASCSFDLADTLYGTMDGTSSTEEHSGGTSYQEDTSEDRDLSGRR